MNTEDHEDQMRKRRFYLFIATIILMFILATTISNIGKKGNFNDGVSTVQTNAPAK